MNVIFIGGIGFIGRNFVLLLECVGYCVILVLLFSGVDILSGEGLVGVFVGVELVVDVSNFLLFEVDVVMCFFCMFIVNLFVVGLVVGVWYYLVLLVVGVDWLVDNGYMCVKVVQEVLIQVVGLFYMIVCVIQFFEFLSVIVGEGMDVCVLLVLFQFIVVVDVVVFLVIVVVQGLQNVIVEIGGFQWLWMSEVVQ